MAGYKHNEKRLLRSFLAIRNLVNFFGKVKDVANSRCLVDMNITHQQARERWLLTLISYLREASASLLVLLYRAIPEPLIAE